MDFQQHTFAEYDDTDLLMPSGHFTLHWQRMQHTQQHNSNSQRHKLWPSLSFTKEDFDIWIEHYYDEKKTTTAWMALQAMLLVSS